MMRKIILLCILVLLLSSFSFAVGGDIEFGTNASISASDYIAYDRFNRTDSTTLGNLATGQVWAESIGDSEIAGKMLKQSATSSETVYFNQVLDVTTTRNYTIDWIARVDAVSGDEWRDLLIRGAANCGGSYATIGVDGDVSNQDMGIYLSVGPVRHKLSPITNWFSLTNTTVLYRAHINVTGGSINLTAFNVTEVDGSINLKEIASKAHVAYSMLTSVGSICIEYSDDTANTLNTTELAIYNGTARPGFTNPSDPPFITNYSDQGASCTKWNTNASNPCNTTDTTPTLYFNTNEAAYCRIAPNSLNYTEMGSSRTCASGDATTVHVCDLIPDDVLVYEDSTVYLSCRDASENMNQSGKSTSGPLKINLTGLDTQAKNSIESGIQNSLPSVYTIYTDQKVYARNSADTQKVGAFDKVVKKLSKIWAFNWIGPSESHVNMMNITPVLYTLEFANVSSTNITLKVELLINSTK